MKKETLKSEEIQLKLLEIAKTDSDNLKSIQKNVRFFAWLFIITIIVGFFLFFITLGNK